jgi:hypothetical protein
MCIQFVFLVLWPLRRDQYSTSRPRRPRDRKLSESGHVGGALAGRRTLFRHKYSSIIIKHALVCTVTRQSCNPQPHSLLFVPLCGVATPPPVFRRNESISSIQRPQLMGELTGVELQNIVYFLLGLVSLTLAICLVRREQGQVSPLIFAYFAWVLYGTVISQCSNFDCTCGCVTGVCWRHPPWHTSFGHLYFIHVDDRTSVHLLQLLCMQLELLISKFAARRIGFRARRHVPRQCVYSSF